MSDSNCDLDGTCVTCSDRLDAVCVAWVSADGATAGVRGGDGGVDVISTELLDGVQPGDVVLVHGGVALQRATTEVTA